MTTIPAIAIVGASGRMGQMLIRMVNETDRATLAGVTERPGHDWIGKDLGLCMGGAETGVIVEGDPLELFARSQAVIDFTSPDSTVALAELAAQARAVHVIGTTGLTDAHLDKLTAAARHAVVIRAGNMRLGEAAAAGRHVQLKNVSDRGRDGITGARKRGDIGFSAIRGGDIVGEHDVIFAADGERIVLRHIATDRRIFARGAIKAAIWGQGRAPGEYDMMDVLGL